VTFVRRSCTSVGYVIGLGIVRLLACAVEIRSLLAPRDDLRGSHNTTIGTGSPLFRLEAVSLRFHIRPVSGGYRPQFWLIAHAPLHVPQKRPFLRRLWEMPFLPRCAQDLLLQNPFHNQQLGTCWELEVLRHPSMPLHRAPPTSPHALLCG
jgi:hypothetical protein